MRGANSWDDEAALTESHASPSPGASRPSPFEGEGRIVSGLRGETTCNAPLNAGYK